MPYLTPDELPEDDDCRPLFIPASTEWLAIVSGAITELLKSYNWQQFGAVTVEEAVERMQVMVDAYYDAACEYCVLPGGGSVVRIRADGRLEVLTDGEWVIPTEGDYYIPPPAAREGGTEQDQICLAAKNAVNVLDQLYESLSESWADNLSTAEAITEGTLILSGLLSFAIGPITAAIGVFMFALFEFLYLALEYLGADLWDEAFSDQLTCMLVECAINDAGVVTFDWECFTGQLNSLADSFELSEVQLRLYAQVMYMLYWIGGVDGLNLAAGTTEITDDNCPCFGWCHLFEVGDDILTFWDLVVGSVSGSDIVGAWNGSVYEIQLTTTLLADVDWQAVYYDNWANVPHDIYLVNDDTSTIIWQYTGIGVPSTGPVTQASVIAAGTNIRLEMLQVGSAFHLQSIALGNSEDANPYGDDNCP